MTEYVVICKSCGEENHEWREEYDTYWFTCINCHFDNELVKGWK